FLTDADAGEPIEPYGVGRNPETVEIDHFSPTTLNNYLKCPRLYWYNHHPGLVEEPRSVAMERGGFLHEVLQDFHEQEEEWRPLEAEQQRQWLEAALQRHLDGYLSRMEGVDEEGKPLGFQPRFLSLWYPKDWVWGGMRQDIFSIGRPAGLKEYREKPLTAEDLERSRAVVVTAIERIKAGHFEPAPRELP